MERFQDLLTQAAQLKQQQLKQERKNFQALPEYLKSGLNFAKKYTQLRKQHYLLQQYISQKLKKQGNDQYMLQNYTSALSNYQQALSIFRYIRATKYQNLKDEDIVYQNYNVIEEEYRKQHEGHLLALYLNICSALTKMNKKEEAVHAAEEAMKINDNIPKVYYKKAQAYLQYINRDGNDVKLGFYYLNRAYELSKDQGILSQMHKIKKELDEQREKEKNWFKFMFDKTTNMNRTHNTSQTVRRNIQKQLSSQSQINNKINQTKIQSGDNRGQMRKQQSQLRYDDGENKSNSDNNDLKSKRMKLQLDKFHQQHNNSNSQHAQIILIQKQILQQTKLLLKPYLVIPRDDRWLIKYQQDFIHNHGSKIYSILQLNTKNHLFIQFKSLLAKCLELKQARITPQRDQTKLLDEKIVMYGKFVEWIKNNCVQGGYRKYVERYNVQTEWITANRGLPIDEVYTKQELSSKTLKSSNPKHKNRQPEVYQKNQVKRQQHKIQQKAQDFINQVRKNISQDNKQGKRQQKKKRTRDDKRTEFKFKQQWEHELEEEQQRKEVSTNRKKQHQQTEDEVPANIKAYLENYDELPMFGQQHKQQHYDKQILLKQANITQQQYQQVKQQQNSWSFFKTFIIISALVVLFKLIF